MHYRFSIIDTHTHTQLQFTRGHRFSDRKDLQLGFFSKHIGGKKKIQEKNGCDGSNDRKDLEIYFLSAFSTDYSMATLIPQPCPLEFASSRNTYLWLWNIYRWILGRGRARGGAEQHPEIGYPEFYINQRRQQRIGDRLSTLWPWQKKRETSEKDFWIFFFRARKGDFPLPTAPAR